MTRFERDTEPSSCANCARLTAENDKLRLRAVAAEHSRTLDLLGKSSYQEVVEQDLRVKLAEAEIDVARLTAALQIEQAATTSLRANGLPRHQHTHGRLAAGEGYSREAFEHDRFGTAGPIAAGEAQPDGTK